MAKEILAYTLEKDDRVITLGQPLTKKGDRYDIQIIKKKVPDTERYAYFLRMVDGVAKIPDIELTGGKIFPDTGIQFMVAKKKK